MNRRDKVHTYGFRKIKGVFGALALTTMVSITLPQIASADTIDDIAEDDVELIEDVAEDAVYEEDFTDVEEDVAEVEAPVEIYEEPAEVVEEVYEEVVEEVVEEVYEEIVEEAAPEVTEPVVEEAPAEEMTEDIIEEVYEEVTEEIVEEAAPEVVEPVIEEAPAEDVAEDLVEEDAAPVLMTMSVDEDVAAEDKVEDIATDEVDEAEVIEDVEEEISEDVIEDAPVEDVVEDTVDEIIEDEVVEDVEEEELVEDEAKVEMFALQANDLSDDPIHKDNLDELRADQTYDSAIQEEISYQLINKHRGENGKAHIHMNDDLNTFAQLRAADMAINGYYDHVRPEALGGWDVATQYNEYMDATTGLTVAENIYHLSFSTYQYETVEDVLGGRYVYRDIVRDDDGNPVRNEDGGLTFVDKASSAAERAFTSWVNSPAHNENMLRDNLTAMGIGFHAALNETGNAWDVFAVQTISLSNRDIETTQNDNFIEKDLDEIHNPLEDDEEVVPPAPEEPTEPSEPTEPEDGDDNAGTDDPTEDDEEVVLPAPEEPTEPEEDNVGTDDPTDPSNNGDDEVDTEPSEPTEPEDGNDVGEEDIENPVTDDPTDPGNSAGEGEEEQPSEPSTPEDGDDNAGTDDPTDPSNNGDDDEDIVDPDTPVDNENDETSEEDNTEDSEEEADVGETEDSEDTDVEENEEDPIEKPIEGDGEGQGTNIKVYDEDGNQVPPFDPRYNELLEKQLAEEAAQEGEDDETVDEDGDVIEKPEQLEDTETPADGQEDIGTDAGGTETPVYEDNNNVTGDTEISHDAGVELLPQTGLASDSKALLATVLAFLGSIAIFARRK